MRNPGARNPGDGVGTIHLWIRQNILGLIAIFIALSGTAFAAQVADNHGKAHAAKKKAKRGPAGPQGPQGPQGLQGPQGNQGPAGPNNVTVVRAQVSINSGVTDHTQASCPGGQRATGGGAAWSGGGDAGSTIIDSGPLDASGL